MDQETPTVYLHKVNYNKESKAVTVIVTDEPLTAESAGKGIKIGNTYYVSTSRRNQVSFGILVLKNKKTGKLLKHSPQALKELQKLKPGTPFPNFEFSDNSVRDAKGDPVGNLVWVVDAEPQPKKEELPF